MLSATTVRPRASRLRVIAATALPTARAAALGSAAATVALGVTPLVITVARGGTNFGVAAVVAGLVGGATFAWAADDPMADILASMPVGNAVRFTMRVAFTAAVTAIVWSIAATVAAVGPGLPPDLSLRVAEAAAAATMALVVGVGVARLGERHSGATGVIGGLLVMATITGLAQRWRWLPALPDGAAHHRWWWVAVAGLAVLLRVARDPGRR